MNLSVIILCKDEETTIGAALEHIARQTLLDRPGLNADIVVVANGCTDQTAARARAFEPLLADRPHIALHVFDLPVGGKSRSWNRAVHEFADQNADMLLFLDSDIELQGDDVFARLADRLTGDSRAVACTGYPMKAVARKAEPGLIDRFSLLMSRQTRHAGALNGSLYLMRGQAARGIWLPDDTPGEDGFLNAMVKTNGFSAPPEAGRVQQVEEVSQYFHAHSPGEFIGHERRMFVGTIINRWMFEHMWSLKLSEPAGAKIDQWNRENPHWVEEIIERNSRGRSWLIPHEMVFGRFRSPRVIGWLRFIVRLPVAVAATLLTIPPAIMANKILKQKGAASHW